jgi:GT2 family glycosyltransferase
MLDRAVIAYIHPGTVRAEFMRSMLNLVVACHDRVEAVISLQSGPTIASARNDVVGMFLADHKAPWLWMLDTDMVFTPDALERLVAAAHPKERPIVGALCYKEGVDGPLPTIYELVTQADGSAAFANYDVWPENEVFQVGGTGAACLLIHRDALKRVASGWGDKVDRVFPWFRESTMGARAVGEDLTFCLRAQSAGLPVYVHTGVQVGHMKSTMLGKVA